MGDVGCMLSSIFLDGTSTGLCSVLFVLFLFLVLMSLAFRMRGEGVEDRLSSIHSGEGWLKSSGVEILGFGGVFCALVVGTCKTEQDGTGTPPSQQHPPHPSIHLQPRKELRSLAHR